MNEPLRPHDHQAGPHVVERRKGPARTNLLLSAAVETGETTIPVRIRDLSEQGAQLESRNLPAVGMRFILRRLDLSAAATVIWSHAGRCGARFDANVSVANWRWGSYVAPAGSEQARIDAIQAAARLGGIPFGHASAPAAVPCPTEEDIGIRIAAELKALQSRLDAMGERLADEPSVIEHCADALQAFDRSSQILGHLASILTSTDRATSIDIIGMEDLRRRLLGLPCLEDVRFAETAR